MQYSYNQANIVIDAVELFGGLPVATLYNNNFFFLIFPDALISEAMVTPSEFLDIVKDSPAGTLHMQTNQSSAHTPSSSFIHLPPALIISGQVPDS